MRFIIPLLLCVVGEFSELGVGRAREGVGCGKGRRRGDGSPGTGCFPFPVIMFYTAIPEPRAEAGNRATLLSCRLVDHPPFSAISHLPSFPCVLFGFPDLGLLSAGMPTSRHHVRSAMVSSPPPSCTVPPSPVHNLHG